MSSIVPFDFEHHQVRVIEQEGEPWFFAKDVCDALGYINSRDAIARHCKASNTVAIHDGIPGNPNVTLIPESVRREAAALGIVLNNRRWDERLGRAI